MALVARRTNFPSNVGGLKHGVGPPLGKHTYFISLLTLYCMSNR